MLEELQKFKTLSQAVSFYNNCNPARQKFWNVLEPEPRNNSYHKEFTGISPQEVWSAVAVAIGRALDTADEGPRWAWMSRNIGDSERLSVDDIAKDLGKCKRTIWRWLNDIDDEISRMLIARGVLEAEDQRFS